MHDRNDSWWARWLDVRDLLLLIRVPLLLVAVGVVLAHYVPQISELIDISLSGEGVNWSAWAYAFAAVTGVLVWSSARTLYMFVWPNMAGSLAVQQRIGSALPRALAAAVPLTLAAAYFRATPGADVQGAQYAWACAYLGQAAALVLATRYRRDLLRRATRRLGRNPEWLVEQPPVGRLTHWQQLGWSRHVHSIGVLALVASSVVGVALPETLTMFGPLALVLGAAAVAVWASTLPIYLATRARLPLISLLLIWATLMTWMGGNDNHAVRLSATQHSDDDPPTGLDYDRAGRSGLPEFIDSWWTEQRRERCAGKVYFVSSEGGGIRAALWTVLVLAELERVSGDRLWYCTLAASGVSGGSLGLAVFASQMRDSGGRVNPDRLLAFMQRDYLTPVLGALFGVDQLQRLWPWRVFTDRGEALERAWVEAYQQSVSPGADSSFAGPLSATAYARTDGQPLTALFLNTTIVGTGQRLIQHPFNRLGAALDFPGAVDGAKWLPSDTPVFSAVHNSARFTLVSPAGTVRKNADGRISLLGQLVDGGYFENSGTTTLEALIQQFSAQAPVTAKIRVIHISNDAGVEPMMADGEDRCPGSDAGAVELYGEVRAPMVAVLETRNARAQFARRALLDRVSRLRDAKLWHYRLCNGKHVLPLGWTVGAASTAEMQRQLRGNGQDQAANTAVMTQSLLDDWQAATTKTQRERQRMLGLSDL